MLSEENGFTVCHHCDYCAIMSLKCSQETFSYGVMNNWVFELYPVAFTVHNFKARLDIQDLFATFYFFLIVLYLDNTKAVKSYFSIREALQSAPDKRQQSFHEYSPFHFMCLLLYKQP